MKSIWHHFKALLPTMFVVYISTVTVLCVLVIISLQTGIRISYFTSDPATVMRAPSYIGVLSNIGILLWCSSAAICLFIFAILQKSNDKELSSFFLVSGLITSILLLDDLFLLHETIYPVYLHIPEKVVITGYGIMTLLYLMKFKREILKTEFLLLFFAFVFFGASAVMDILLIHVRPHYLFEDGFKLLGIVSWSTYFTRVCLKQMCNVLRVSKCE